VSFFLVSFFLDKQEKVTALAGHARPELDSRVAHFMAGICRLLKSWTFFVSTGSSHFIRTLSVSLSRAAARPFSRKGWRRGPLINRSM
jgi:hypothetical protein